MIPIEKASELIAQNVTVLGKTTVPLLDAVGHVPFDDILSPVDIAPFRNSAMDGFAVSSESINARCPGESITLSIKGTVYAGQTICHNGNGQDAVKVMTGAPVPDGYDSVVKFEDTKYDDNVVTLTKPVTAGQNVRLPGEDLKQGEKILSAGDLINSVNLGVMAGAGLHELAVHKRPKLLIVSTGDELALPGDNLQPGQIYNSNYYTIRSFVDRFCAGIDSKKPVGDSINDLRAALDADHDIIITSGGVSAGEKDLVVQAAVSCGWESLFHKVAIKPGKPIFFARRKNQLLFGLPGNPLSAAVTCALFVIPALKKMTGRTDFSVTAEPAQLADNSPAKSGRTVVWPGKIWHENGMRYVRFSDKRSSAALSALLQSDGLIFQSQANDGSSTPTIKAALWHHLLT